MSKNNIDIKGFEGCDLKGSLKIKGLKMVGVSGQSGDKDVSIHNDIKMEFANKTTFMETEAEDITIVGAETRSPRPSSSQQPIAQQESLVSLNRNFDDGFNAQSHQDEMRANIEGGSNFMDKFQFKRHIASGGFGSVYQVKDKNDEEIYVLKKIPITDNSNEDNYLREVRMLSKAKSDLVVEYTTSWILNDHLYIQMAYYNNNLRDYLNEKSDLFDRSMATNVALVEYFVSCKLFEQIVVSVDFLHNLDPPIIHRDLKPENIMIDMDSKSAHFVRLCDFGLAKLHDQLLSHTRAQGTFRYMAPEVSTSTHYDWRCDIYSLAAIGKELFGFDNNDWNSIDTIERKWCILKQIIENGTGLAIGRLSCRQMLDVKEDWSLVSHDLKTVDAQYFNKNNSNSFNNLVKSILCQ